MESSHIMDSLNPAQRKAVAAPPGNLLILAGAGSGKTRVLVHRIAWLLEVAQVPARAILAVTFTNKAAREMRERLNAMQTPPLDGMWMGTFHGLAHRFLRIHWQDAKLPQQFQILDSDDQIRLIKRILKNAELDETRWPPRQVQNFINTKKDEGKRPHHLHMQNHLFLDKMLTLYREYEIARVNTGGVDFADLLFYALELLRERKDILQQYQQRFQHILVDEFQDTNTTQYAWLRLLAGLNNNLFVVGDDDQSIYSWRGARVEHLQMFQNDYPTTQIIRLEQNYRSTGTILAAANAVISHNTNRLGKNLWTQDGPGSLLKIYGAYNEIEEARFVVEQILQYISDFNGNPSDCAILYRTTAQSRLFEESLLQANLAYRVYGGLRFFERAEIRDTLAYLRLIINPNDDAAFERIVNTPSRGIGQRTLHQIREYGQIEGISLWTATHALVEAGTVARATGALRKFLTVIAEQQTFRAQANLTLAEFTQQLINNLKLPDFYKKEKDERSEDRLENLDQLIQTIKRFETEPNNSDGEPLAAFLAHAALESGDSSAGSTENCVQIMTLHSAKGLEFPLVFLAGLEDGLFPHSLSIEDAARLEEERRLCYVGMTRAMHRLILTYAARRAIHGHQEMHKPSRFLYEIPQELYEEIREDSAARWTRITSTGGGRWRVGQLVRHPTFGDGQVLDHAGNGTTERVQVRFASGVKWLALAYAKLEEIKHN